MSENIQELLQQLNFLPNEQKVYLASLKVGKGSVVSIAKEAKVERTSTFRILQKFENRGLIERVPSGKRMLWQARHPRFLEETLKNEKKALDELIPQLSALYSRKEEPPKISYYEGHEAVVKTSKDIVTEGKHRSEILSFSSPGAFAPALSRKEWDKLVKERIKKQITTKIMMPDLGGAPGYKEGEDWKNWRITKLVDAAKYPFKVTVNVAADKVSIMAVRRKIPIAIIIDDREITETFRMIFDMCWGSQSTQ